MQRGRLVSEKEWREVAGENGTKQQMRGWDRYKDKGGCCSSSTECFGSELSRNPPNQQSVRWNSTT